MWKNIVAALLNVRPGLTKANPTNKTETLKQPFFGNSLILNTSGTSLGIGGRREGYAFTRSGCSRVKDLWNLKDNEWKSLSELGMNYHASNKRCKDAIIGNIPWRPDECTGHIRAGDWISSRAPNPGTPLDWIYFVLESDQSKANVIEFQKNTPSGRIQALTHQVPTLSTANYRPIRVLSQERSESTLKVTKDPPAPGKKPFF
ncbi:unnamed protein product [Sphagnum jensenii]|uniref:LAGLIDADG homing endonuclease n=1 Tax=Sphagnum jensenii TaxID=128206 RepID=A0ABP1BPS8_9BRYO